MIRILLGLALLVPVASFAQEPSADAVDETAPPAKDWRSSEGFQAARWGMTKAEVRKLFPGARQQKHGDDALAISKTQVADRMASVVFFFVMDRLASVVVSFEVAASNDVTSKFDRLVELLKKKYGEPADYGVRWSNASAKELFADDHLDLGTAVVMGDASLSAKWESSESTIGVGCSSNGRLHSSVALLYFSKRLEPARAEHERRKASSDL